MESSIYRLPSGGSEPPLEMAKLKSASRWATLEGNGNECANYGQGYFGKGRGHPVILQALAEARNWQFTAGTRPTRSTIPEVPAKEQPSTKDRKRSATPEALHSKARNDFEVWNKKKVLRFLKLTPDLEAVTSGPDVNADVIEEIRAQMITLLIQQKELLKALRAH